MPCLTNVNQTVCVNAEVRILPDVTSGDPITTCVGNPFIGNCSEVLAEFCVFRVSQRICVEIPLTFDATAVTTPTGIVCETDPTIGNCGAGVECTFSQGYFSTHPTVVENLIAENGGSILLGLLDDDLEPDGLSIEVTVDNYQDVFDGTIPVPDGSRGPQYRQLYQQLLAAKLNVINGAECAAGQAAIDAADQFLADSPPEGLDGAPALSSALDAFNTGEIPGCPTHCPEDTVE